MTQIIINEKRFSRQRRRAVPLPLRLVTGLGTLAAAAALVFSAATARPAPSIELAAGPGSTISILNSREGLAVLSAGNMRPGDTATGSVTITNTGDGDGIFSLSQSALNDVSGAGAGILSGKLDLTVVDSTTPATPVAVYTGKANGLGVIPLGTYAAGEARTYDFTVSFPNGAIGAENAYQGASMSVTLDWDAVLVAASPAPAVSSATPLDGATVASASSPTLTTNVALATVQAPTLDGSAVGTTVSGTHVTFVTGALSSAPHTIAGVLEGLDGQTTPFRLHFTVWSLPTSDYPYVEMNSPAGEEIELTASNGAALLEVAANSWSSGASGDWVVFRLDPAPSPSATGGLAGASDLYSVSAYWALSTGGPTTFDKALDLRLGAGAGPVIPAVYESGAWRRLEKIPSGTALPAGWNDGYYASGAQVHVLTKRTGAFGLLRDVDAPSKPKKFSSSRLHGHVVLKWRPAKDNEAVDAYLVYARGRVLRTLPASARSYDLGRVKSTDKRAFAVAARDAAGNVGPKTGALVAVPTLAGLTLADAKSALRKRGLKAGAVRREFSLSTPEGHVIRGSKTGVVPKGTSVALTVSKGAHERAQTSSGGTGAGDYGQPTYTPTPSSTPSYPTYPQAPVPFPTTTPTVPNMESHGSGDGTDARPADTAGASPQRFTGSEPSSARRTAGLVLLACLFLGAGAMALRARRRLIAPMTAAENVDGPILFWDERLLRGTASALRRAFGTLGR